MEKPLIVYCTPNRASAEELFATLRSELPGVELVHYLNGGELLQALQAGAINPTVILMAFHFDGVGDAGLPGDILTKRVIDINPEIAVIGYAPGMDEKQPELGQKTIGQAFKNMGAVACVDPSQPVEDLLAELENWLEEEEDKWPTVPIALGFAAFMAIFAVVLMTAPWLLFNFYAFPVGVVVFAVFAALLHFKKLPVEICLPVMFSALAPIVAGGLLYLAASNMSPIMFIVALIVGWFAYNIFFRESGD